MGPLKKPRSDDALRKDVHTSNSETQIKPLSRFRSNAEKSGINLQKHHSETTALKTDNELKLAEKVIVVMGPTGVGKSRFIREASHLDVGVSDSLESVTQTLQAYHFTHKGSQIALVDTPGFNDTYKPDTLIFRELAAWLAARYQEKTQLTAIIYIQRITDTRISGSTLRNLVVMKRMLGIETFPYLTLVTSMWDLCDTQLANSREKEYTTKFWKELVDSGANIGRFWGDQRSALDLIDMTASKPLPSMAIQNELIDRRLMLNQTSAGIYLNQELKIEDKNVGIGRAQDLEASWNIDYGSLWLEDTQEHESSWGPTIYQTLQPNQIRILRLFAGTSLMPVEISLATSSLEEAPPFAAVSYVVGKSTVKEQISLRDGMSSKPYSVALNLQQVLAQLRRPHTDIFIWIDALCINQADHKERAEQVKNMLRIYQQAINVCIWLGPQSADTDAALTLAKDILDLDIFEDALQDNINAHKFALLANLMCNSWFSRRWCVQEILVAKSATIHCGSNVMPWSDFVDVVDLLSLRWQELQQITRGQSVRTIAHAELTGAVSLIWTSRKIFRRNSYGDIIDKSLGLETLLSELSTFDVTIPHDAVYAVLELACDVAGHHNVKVDYSIEPRDLFKKVIDFIVKCSGSLDIICQPWAPPLGLPSWMRTTASAPFQKVRNLRGEELYQRRYGNVLVGSPDLRTYQACGSRTARGTTSFREESSQFVLSAKGLEIGQLSKVGNECVDGLIHNKWLELAGWTDIFLPVPERFWKTLVADRDSSGMKAPPWYKRACEKAFRDSTRHHFNTDELLQTSKSVLVKSYLLRVQSVTWSRKLASLETGDFTHRGSTSVGQCSCSLTQGSHSHSQTCRFNLQPHSPRICLCPAETQAGDIVCILYGCSVPVVLRPFKVYYGFVGECFVDGIMDGEAVSDGLAAGVETVYDIV